MAGYSLGGRLRLAMDYHGLMPFFIQWGKDAVHPSVDAPKGCRLEKFVVCDSATG